VDVIERGIGLGCSGGFTTSDFRGNGAAINSTPQALRSCEKGVTLQAHWFDFIYRRQQK
jgi:hypothetical protein